MGKDADVSVMAWAWKSLTECAATGVDERTADQQARGKAEDNGGAFVSAAVEESDEQGKRPCGEQNHEPGDHDDILTPAVSNW
jgi:hypothetical protein